MSANIGSTTLGARRTSCFATIGAGLARREAASREEVLPSGRVGQIVVRAVGRRVGEDVAGRAEEGFNSAELTPGGTSIGHLTKAMSAQVVRAARRAELTPGDILPPRSSSFSLSFGDGTVIPNGTLRLLLCILLSVRFNAATGELGGPAFAPSFRPPSSERRSLPLGVAKGKKSERRNAVVDALDVHWT